MAERNEKREHMVLIMHYCQKMIDLDVSAVSFPEGIKNIVKLSELIDFHVTEVTKVALREKAHNA